jgi:hypothetical protein
MNNGMLLEPGPTLDSLKKYFTSISDSAFDSEADNFNYCGSGKAAISSILSYLHFTGVLKDKMSPILVPRWMGVEVYGVMMRYSFPTFDAHSNAKVLIAYHQYGFPQDMDRILDFAQSKKMIVIEDCAHAVNSKYKGKRLGSIGDFSIYSFSKFAYCNVLGGVGFKNYEFNQFFNEHLKKSSKTLATIINLIKLLSTYNINRGGGKVVNLGLTNGLTSMAYSRYTDSLVPSRGSINMFEKQFKKECILRLENYQYIKEALDEYGVFEHLTGNISVIPYAVPLKLPLKISQRIVKKLRILGLETGIYNFDIDRFMPEPNFIKTILLPCHSNLSRTTISSMIDIIVSEIRA